MLLRSLSFVVCGLRHPASIVSFCYTSGPALIRWIASFSQGDGFQFFSLVTIRAEIFQRLPTKRSIRVYHVNVSLKSSTHSYGIHRDPLQPRKNLGWDSGQVKWTETWRVPMGSGFQSLSTWRLSSLAGLLRWGLKV